MIPHRSLWQRLLCVTGLHRGFPGVIPWTLQCPHCLRSWGMDR